MNSIIVIVVIAAIVLFAVYKIKENKEYKESKRKEDEAWEKECQERKKNGEPSVCTKLPGGAANPEEGEPVDIGVDGKSYACAKLYSDSMVINNYRDTAYDFEHKKYECSPVFCMLAYEYHIADYVKRLTGANPMHIVDIRTGLNCIFDLAESYAYPVAVNDDLTQADYYTIRRLKDRKRAMEGNGYYKNAYDFPIDTDKALSYFELLELLRIKCTDKLSEIGNYYTFILSRAWMQTAHLCSAGLRGVKKDVDKAIKLYSQMFQMAVSFSLEDDAYQIIHALTDGYPRNPEDYQVQAHNMLADWACNSDFGLALYVEYIMHVEDMDRKALAESPKSVVQFCREQAENNHYAAFLLGRALLYGYGIAKDETLGREMLEIAAENGCVSALYLLTQLSIGDVEQEKKWKDALDKTVAKVKDACGFMREVLQNEGMSVTQARMEEMYRKMNAENAENQRRMHDVLDEWQRDADEAEREKRERKAAANAARDEEWLDDLARGFDFPHYLYDDDSNPWELMNSGYNNATYYCQKTGQTVFVHDTDFEFGAPSGFHCR